MTEQEVGPFRMQARHTAAHARSRGLSFTPFYTPVRRRSPFCPDFHAVRAVATEGAGYVVFVARTMEPR